MNAKPSVAASCRGRGRRIVASSFNCFGLVDAENYVMVFVHFVLFKSYLCLQLGLCVCIHELLIIVVILSTLTSLSASLSFILLSFSRENLFCSYHYIYIFFLADKYPGVLFIITGLHL